jgi:uncharacterized membrane protein/uncharacterized membrane protein YvlD (DUF360 family)
VRVIQAFLHWLGFGLCHQLPERSFFGGGVQVPVCARDTGIYLGFMISLVLISVLHRGSRPREFPAPAGWVAVALMIGAMGFDGVSSYAGFRTTTNDLRLITGLLAGYAIGAVLAPMFNDVFWSVGSRERVLDPAWRLYAWLATIPLAFVAIRYAAPLLGIGYPLLVAATIVATLTAVNLVMVCLAPSFERKADRITDAWAAILVAVALSFFEIWLSGLLRLWLESMVSRLG